MIGHGSTGELVQRAGDEATGRPVDRVSAGRPLSDLSKNWREEKERERRRRGGEAERRGGRKDEGISLSRRVCDKGKKSSKWSRVEGNNGLIR
jgi:hypothetical protein